MRRSGRMTPSTYVRASDALWHRTSGRTLVNTSLQTEAFELRGIPALLWEALRDPVPLDELVHDFAAVFGQPTGSVRNELLDLIVDLVAIGAVSTG